MSTELQTVGRSERAGMDDRHHLQGSTPASPRRFPRQTSESHRLCPTTNPRVAGTSSPWLGSTPRQLVEMARVGPSMEAGYDAQTVVHASSAREDGIKSTQGDAS